MLKIGRRSTKIDFISLCFFCCKQECVENVTQSRLCSLMVCFIRVCCFSSEKLIPFRKKRFLFENEYLCIKFVLWIRVCCAICGFEFSPTFWLFDFSHHQVKHKLNKIKKKNTHTYVHNTMELFRKYTIHVKPFVNEHLQEAHAKMKWN